MRNITAVIIDRANYGRLLPVLQQLHTDPRFRLRLVLGGAFVLRQYGSPWRMLERDGLSRVPRQMVYHEVAGNCPASRTQSIGLGVCQYASALERDGSEWVLLIGDRYEALAAAQAAVFSGRQLVHVQGGERSATMDEPTRHAITQLAHYHVPATPAARDTLIHRLGQPPETILTVGCPASDLARRVRGSGGPAGGGYVLVMYHPSGTDPAGQMDRVLAGVYPFTTGPGALRLLVWWPNIDPGSDAITRRIRFHRRRRRLEVVRHLHPEDFLQLVQHARVCVGNSSAFVRDAGYFGTPIVIVGDRQARRERTVNTMDVPRVDARGITAAIARQLDAGRYLPDHLYGDGRVSKRLADALHRARPITQQHLHDDQPRRDDPSPVAA